MMADIYRTLKSTLSEFKAESVFVIGKGRSTDSIDLRSFAEENNALVVTINDSENVIPGGFTHIRLISRAWAERKIQWSELKCGAMLTLSPVEPLHRASWIGGVYQLTPIPADLEGSDFLLTRLINHKQTFFAEDAAYLNAIKIASIAAEIAGKDADFPVFFFGFDFDSTISSEIKSDVFSSPSSHRTQQMREQEIEFHRVRAGMAKWGAYRPSLNHCGTKTYSNSIPVTRAQSPQTRDYSKVPDRTLVVAEFTNNHHGDMHQLQKMIARAIGSGADLIKVQMRDVDSFYTPEQLASPYDSPFGSTLGDYRRGVELTDEMLDTLDNACKAAGIDWFCSVLDYKSFQRIKKYNPKLIKIPSTISNHHSYMEKLAQEYTGPIVVSTGYTDDKYLDYVCNTFKKNSALYLLHCVSSYPTAADDCNVNVVGFYRDFATLRDNDRLGESQQQIIPGYSSHDLGSTASCLAIAAGARMIEKHVKFGDADWVHFDKVAVNMENDDFAKFVADLRHTEKILGSPEKKVLACEHHKYGHEVK